jgi:hypothetical protein
MASYNFGLSAVYDLKKEKGHFQSFVAWIWSVKGLLKWQTLKPPKLVQLDRAFKWFTVHSEGNPMTGAMIIEKAKYFVMK